MLCYGQMANPAVTQWNSDKARRTFNPPELKTKDREKKLKKVSTVFLFMQYIKRFLMRFRYDFHAIWRTKPAPAYPARVFSRVTLRKNPAKLAEIVKEGVFK